MEGMYWRATNCLGVVLFGALFVKEVLRLEVSDVKSR